MFVVYLLWIVFVSCGAFMGISAIQAIREDGFAWSLLLNAVLFLGIALYGVPKLIKLVLARR